MTPILLLTRPEPQSRRFAEQARAALPPHSTVIAPLSQIEPVSYDADAFSGAAGVILTSANAVPMLPPMPGLAAWCVGPATTRAAQAAGLRAIDGGGDAASLIAAMTARHPAGVWVHAHGVHLARDIVADLTAAGIEARGVTVYEARARDWPGSVAAALAQGRPVIVALFSPRAAEGFVRNLGSARPAGLRVVAISAACAARLPDDLTVHVADQPDAGGMLRALGAAMSQAARSA